MARVSGRTSLGSAALAHALSTLARPPKRLWSRSGPATVEDIAERVGRDVEEVRRWQAAGLLEVPEAEHGQAHQRSGFDRASLIDLALRSGADERALARAAADGNLIWAALQSVLTSPGKMSGAEAAEAAGMPLETMQLVWQALGLPTGQLATAAAGRRDVHAMRTMTALRTIFTDEDMAEAASVMGRAMSEVATSLIELFRRRLADPLLEAGGTQTDVVIRLAAMRDVLGPTVTPLLEVALERHLDSAIRSELSLRMEELLEPGTGHRVLAVGFVDLVGFTAASEQLSAGEVRNLAQRLHRVTDSCVADNGGRVVKGIGDAVMFTLPGLQSAARAAVQVVQKVEADAMLPPVRVGLAHGPVLPGYADYFGRTVNLASRLCSVAQPGEVLLHSEVEHAQQEDHAGAEGVAAERRTVSGLKGIDGAVEVLALRPS